MKINIGKKIKDITITTTDNKNKLSDYLNKNLILYFYPRDMTPGCTTESIEFNENISKIKRAGWNVVGVSRDTIKSHLKFIDKHSFKFPLISDEDEALCNQFEVIKLKKLYGKEYMGIVRSTFVISPNGEILKHWDKVKVDGHADEVLEFVNGL